jgi:dolichol-phosphate mannosyltransferase
MDLNGPSHGIISMFLKWMLIFLIIQMIFRAFMMLAKTEGADVAIGSRYVKGGGVVNWPSDRKALSKGGSLYTRMITWMPIKDPTAGFMCYKKEVLETINLDQIVFVGYAFQIEMKFAAWKLHFKLKEVPIIFQDPHPREHPK